LNGKENMNKTIKDIYEVMNAAIFWDID
jgi:hypothetical protein